MSKFFLIETRCNYIYIYIYIYIYTYYHLHHERLINFSNTIFLYQSFFIFYNNFNTRVENEHTTSPLYVYKSI